MAVLPLVFLFRSFYLALSIQVFLFSSFYSGLAVSVQAASVQNNCLGLKREQMQRDEQMQRHEQMPIAIESRQA